jgi:hypothetical protein
MIMKWIETLSVRLRYLLRCRLTGCAFLQNPLFDRFRKKQETTQVFGYRQRSDGRGAACRSSIQFIEIHVEEGSGGVRGTARISFVVVPSTPFHKGERPQR